MSAPRTRSTPTAAGRGRRAKGGSRLSPARAPWMGLAQHFSGMGSEVDRARLDDLCHPGTDHSWMWLALALDADHDELTEAIHTRLGAGGPPEPLLCGVCG